MRAAGEMLCRVLLGKHDPESDRSYAQSAEIFASHKQIQIYCTIQLLKNQAEIFQPADDGFFVNR